MVNAFVRRFEQKGGKTRKRQLSLTAEHGSPSRPRLVVGFGLLSYCIGPSTMDDPPEAEDDGFSALLPVVDSLLLPSTSDTFPCSNSHLLSFLSSLLITDTDLYSWPISDIKTPDNSQP